MEKTMLPSAIVDMKAFVPAKDHKISKAFYTDLGFTINWSNDEIAEQQFRFPSAKVLRRPTCGQFHDEPKRGECGCLVGTHPAHGVD
jgi:hypothetical protein